MDISGVLSGRGFGGVEGDTMSAPALVGILDFEISDVESSLL